MSLFWLYRWETGTEKASRQFSGVHTFSKWWSQELNQAVGLPGLCSQLQPAQGTRFLRYIATKGSCACLDSKWWKQWKQAIYLAFQNNKNSSVFWEGIVLGYFLFRGFSISISGRHLRDHAPAASGEGGSIKWSLISTIGTSSFQSYQKWSFVLLSLQRKAIKGQGNQLLELSLFGLIRQWAIESSQCP